MWTMVASLKSWGKAAALHIASNRSTRCGRRHELHFLKTSAGIPSVPGAFPLDIWFMAFWISALVGTSSRRDASGHCRISDDRTFISKLNDWLRTVPKCSFQRSRIFCVVTESDTVERFDRCRTSFARTINRLQAMKEGPRVVSVSGCL